MRRQFKGGDNKAEIWEASGDYLSVATNRGRRRIEEIQYVVSSSTNSTKWAGSIFRRVAQNISWRVYSLVDSYVRPEMSVAIT